MATHILPPYRAVLFFIQLTPMIAMIPMIVIIYCTIITTTASPPIPNAYYKEKSVSECVSKILAQLPNFTTRLLTDSNMAHTRTDFLDGINAILKTGVVLRAGLGEELAFMHLPNEAIIIINEDLSDIEMYSALTEDNHLDFLLYIYMGDEDVVRVVDYIYGFMLFRALVIDKNAHVYTLNRFEDHCGRNNSATFLFHCANFNTDEVLRVHQRHPPEDFNGCPIYAQYIPMDIAYTQHRSLLNEANMPKIEYKLILEASRSFNSSFVLNPRGALHPDQYTISFGELIMDAYTGFYPLFMDAFVCVVPIGYNAPKWTGLIHAFDTNLWITIFASAIVFILLTYTIAQFAIQPENFDTAQYAALNLYGAFLGQGITKPKYKVMKMVFIVWVFFAFIILNAYTGLFLAHILEPKYILPLNSLDEIFFAGYKVRPTTRDIVYIQQLLQSYLDSDFYFVKYTSNHSISDWNTYNDTALILRQSEVDYLRTSLKEETPKFHTVPLSKFFVSMQTTSSVHPFLRQLNSQMISLYEMGLTDKWKRDDEWIRSIRERRHDDDEFKMLTLEHLGLSFLFLLIGDILAIFALANELYM